MVRYPITAPQSQERPQRKRVRAAPLQTALAVDALEVAHQVHPEIAPGRPPRARPSGPRNKAGSSPRQRRRSRPRSAPTASGHKTHDPESAASPTSSPSGPPDHPSAVPSPSANPPANQGTRESDGANLINGLLRVLWPAKRGCRIWPWVEFLSGNNSFLFVVGRIRERHMQRSAPPFCACCVLVNPAAVEAEATRLGSGWRERGRIRLADGSVVTRRAEIRLCRDGGDVTCVGVRRDRPCGGSVQGRSLW